MSTDSAGNASVSEGVSPITNPLLQRPTGVDRLMKGVGQLELGEKSPDAAKRSPFQEAAVAQHLSRVPGWVFYLGDLVLMSLVLWLIVLDPQPLDRQKGIICVGLVVVAAMIGTWPWLRNVLYCDRLGEVRNLPKWVVVPRAPIGTELKTLVVRLEKPYVAVEITQTSWNGINAKPYWIDGPPGLAPGGVKMLLEEAISFYQENIPGDPVQSGDARSDSAPA